MVAVGLYGEHVKLGHGSKGGWDTFGPERIVTKSDGNVLYELDDKPALALYKEYLGDRAAGLPGSALLFPLALRASKALENLSAENDDQKVGINIVRKALQAPARQIVQNAGEDGSVVVGKILDTNKYVFGYNAQTGEYGDLVEAGVIDPAKVVRCALQDAASIAGLLITTEAMVAERPKEAPPAMPGGGGMGGMGGMDF